ncbi:MAG: integrase/recombinase XerC [Actinomycetota bacterium]
MTTATAVELELAGVEDVEGRSLTPLVLRYLRGRMRRGELSSATARNHWSTLRALADAHGGRSVKAVNTGTIERWMEGRAGLRPATKRTQWSYATRFLDWLVRERLLRVNPMRSLTPPRRPRVVPRAIDQDAIAALLDVVPDARGAAIVWLMVGLGLRCIEVSRLNVEDWSRRDRMLLVTGKGGHQRELPMTREVAAVLNRYLAEHPASSGPLIRGYVEPDRSLRPGTLSHYLAAWMYVAGVKKAPHDGNSGHALRHTCASDVLDECGDLRVVQELLGHQHLSSTSVYLRRAGMAAMREAMEGRTYKNVPTRRE